jgi:hypothetical protein
MNEQKSGTATARQQAGPSSIRARRLGLDTQYEAIVFMHKDCDVCRAEGFSAHTRVLLRNGDYHVIATLYQATGDLIAPDEAALSESAWTRLGLTDGETITVTHPAPLDSLSHLRSRIYGHNLSEASFHAIMQDVVDGKYSDIHLSSFLTACAARALDHREIVALTHAMVEAGERLRWPAGIIADKHCAGGLPGNRTTPIIVAIVASLGLTMPKTSSRAITSPAGTADRVLRHSMTVAPGQNSSGFARLRAECACPQNRASSGRCWQSKRVACRPLTIARLRDWPSSPGRPTTRQLASTCMSRSATRSIPASRYAPSMPRHQAN